MENSMKFSFFFNPFLSDLFTKSRNKLNHLLQKLMHGRGCRAPYPFIKGYHYGIKYAVFLILFPKMSEFLFGLVLAQILVLRIGPKMNS